MQDSRQLRCNRRQPATKVGSFYLAWPLKKVKVKLPIRDRGPFSDAASFVGGDEDWCEPVSDQISGERDQEVHQRTTHSTFLTHFINFAMKEML